MDTEFPSADAYADEPIRHAALEIFDVAAEQGIGAGRPIAA